MTTADTKTFVGILRSSGIKLSKDGTTSFWQIGVGPVEKPWLFNMFDETLGKTLALGKTYRVKYTPDGKFRKFLGIVESEPQQPARMSPDGASGETQDETPTLRDTLIVRQVALKASVEYYNSAVGGLATGDEVTELASVFERYLLTGVPSQSKIDFLPPPTPETSQPPAKQPSTPQQTASVTEKPAPATPSIPTKVLEAQVITVKDPTTFWKWAASVGKGAPDVARVIGMSMAQYLAMHTYEDLKSECMALWGIKGA